MKKMMKRASLLLAVILLFGAFGLTAQAAGDIYAPLYAKQADILKDLGLFLGANTGYHLERAATRAEAAVMLMRLLGAEREAQGGTYEHPFSDVPGWADAAVGYLYTNGLTNGVSLEQKLFGSSRLCDARMYITFVLRALGYSDATGDFSYLSAVSDALELQLFDVSIADGFSDRPFLRDDMVAVSFCGLTANLKGEIEKALIDQLIEIGAVSRDKATPHRDALDAYTSYRKALRLFSQTGDLDAAVSVTWEKEISGQKMSTVTDMAMTAEGLGQLWTATMKMEVHVTKDDGSGPQNESGTYYLKGGWLYISTGSPAADVTKIRTNFLWIAGELTDGSLEAIVKKLFDIPVNGFGINVEQSDIDMNMLSATLVRFTRTADSKTAVYTLPDMSMTLVYDNAGRLKNRALTVNLTKDEMGMTVNERSTAMETLYPAGGVKVDLSGLNESEYTEVFLQDLM